MLNVSAVAINVMGYDNEFIQYLKYVGSSNKYKSD